MRVVLLTLMIWPMLAMAQWLGLPATGAPRTDDGAVDMQAPTPKTAWGTTDLSGIWAATSVTGDLPESDKFMPWVVDTMNQHADNFFADQPRYNCLPSGPAYLTASAFSTGLRRIVQSPEYIAMLHEDMVHRPIYMDGRQLEENPFPTWMGYSIGYWDEATLVVESNGYNDKTWLDRRGATHTEQLRITERYRRTSFGQIQLDVTYEDPGAFTAPLKVSIQLRHQGDDELLELVCNETDQLGSKWEGSTTAAAAEQVAVPLELLQQYVGTYQGQWLGNIITLEFYLEQGELQLTRNGTEIELYPRSQTAFDASNGFGFIFETDELGRAVSVEEVHVSGGWPFPRIE